MGPSAQTDPAPRIPRWLTALVVLLVIAVLSFLTLLVGDAIAAIEEGGEHTEDEGQLHHLFIFDLAWPVYLVTALISLLGGIAALVVWLMRRSRVVGRYAAAALGFSAVSIGLLVALGVLEL